jgi:hypothetical protein
MPLDDQQVRGLLLAIRETHAEEIDCEQFLALMAAYAEARAANGALPEALARVAAHERLCGNCREECSALIELVQAERASNSARIPV